MPGYYKNRIIISKIPIIQTRLKEVIRTHFPKYKIISSTSAENLTLLQLHHSRLVITNLASKSKDPHSIYKHYYSLISQYQEIH